MDFRFTPEEEKWKQEAREFLKKEIPPDYMGEDAYDESTIEEAIAFSDQFRTKLGQKDWLAMSWPEPWSHKRTIIEQCIFGEELGYALAPWLSWGTALGTGASVLGYGTEEQKKRFVPPIRSGEQSYCLGWTETEAGSDMANLQMRAVRDGDDWVVNGQKIFNNDAHRVNGIWLACRTDPAARKHRGISIFVVDKELIEKGGVTIRRMWTMAGRTISEIFIDDVRIPSFNMIGEPNQAWYGALNNTKYLGVGPSSIMRTKRHLDMLVDFCQETKRNGEPLGKSPAIRNELAEFAISVGMERAIWWRENWERADREMKGITEVSRGGGVQPLAGQGTVLWGKEFVPYFYERALQMLGLYGQLKPGSKWAPLAGFLEQEWRDRPSNHAHGTPEIIRLVLATAGLGLPRR